MTKQLLTEFFELCPDGRCLDMLSERQKREVIEEGVIYLTGRIQTAEKKNGNGRVYPRKVLEKEITNYQKIVRDNRATGELDHPEDSVINLKNVSHIVVECWWKGDDVMGKIKVLDTPSGQIAKQLVNGGVQLGISSRGLGSTRQQGGVTMVEDDFQLLCFDLVSEPSTTGAFLVAENKKLDTHLNKSDRIYRAINDVLGDE